MLIINKILNKTFVLPLVPISFIKRLEKTTNRKLTLQILPRFLGQHKTAQHHHVLFAVELLLQWHQWLTLIVAQPQRLQVAQIEHGDR